jgi:hypothetical protein
MSLGKAVSRRILDFCREHNKSIDIVLQKSNASPTEVAAVLDGRDNDIKMDIMQSICDVFGVTMEEFFKCDLFANF